MPAVYWVILGIIMLTGEVFSLDFSLTCFGVAAFAAAGVSAAGLGIYWQLLTVAIALFVLLFTLRPLALKYLIKNKDFKDNMAALIGKSAAVSTVEDGKAWVKIDGDIWAVAAKEPLNIGDIVKIKSIDGTILNVIKEEK